MVAVDFVKWTQLIITSEQDYKKLRCSHVSKRSYTEVSAKPTKYSIISKTSNNHSMWHLSKVSLAYATSVDGEMSIYEYNLDLSG